MQVHAVENKYNFQLYQIYRWANPTHERHERLKLVNLVLFSPWRELI